jgi:hypothetical protein
MTDDQMTPDEFEVALRPRRTATAAMDLLEAARGIAQVMLYSQQGYRESAAYIDRQDSGGQPYPVTLVVMSNHVSALLRALADIEALQARGAEVMDRDLSLVAGQQVTYGPRRRDVE